MRNWVYSATDAEYWRALVNMALNLGSHKPWSQLINNSLRIPRKESLLLKDPASELGIQNFCLLLLAFS